MFLLLELAAPHPCAHPPLPSKKRNLPSTGLSYQYMQELSNCRPYPYLGPHYALLGCHCFLDKIPPSTLGINTTCAPLPSRQRGPPPVNTTLINVDLRSSPLSDARETEKERESPRPVCLPRPP
eukprot:TRINITY_DN10595_c0_g1_i1.p1 TRINITY_DN10595_c0_g1~~TRINITY_DN10595_c0_g1_i1.p1  ORF type:complete len:124 (-),score=5.57 TRINITY_DN10595_c0_g1_i1:626-997(-)